MLFDVIKFWGGLFTAIDYQNLNELHKWLTNDCIHKNAPSNVNVQTQTVPQMQCGKKMGLVKKAINSNQLLDVSNRYF